MLMKLGSFGKEWLNIHSKGGKSILAYSLQTQWCVLLLGRNIVGFKSKPFIVYLENYIILFGTLYYLENSLAFTNISVCLLLNNGLLRTVCSRIPIGYCFMLHLNVHLYVVYIIHNSTLQKLFDGAIWPFKATTKCTFAQAITEEGVSLLDFWKNYNIL